MKIFSFLKKSEKKKKIKEIVSEKLTLSEIENWLEKKKKENEVREKEILVLVKDKIKNFNADLKTKIILLNEFDVESKKAEDRIKGVVSNSRTQYIIAVDNLMASLENLKETKFSALTERIDRIFFDFNKASFKNYEIATILIGKEMANIKERFKFFSKDLLEIFNSNKEISELFQKIGSVKSKLNSLNLIEENMTGLGGTISSLNEKINQKEKESQRFLNEIKRIKQSENYKNMLGRKEKISALKKELRDAVFALKQLIDFKALANFFHINKEQMNILKDHKKDFHANFEKDNGKKIMDLLNESKLNTDAILEKENLIRAKMQETADCKREIKKDETQELYCKIKELITEADNLKIEKIKKEKRNEKFKANKEELINSLKQELGKINIELV